MRCWWWRVESRMCWVCSWPAGPGEGAAGFDVSMHACRLQVGLVLGILILIVSCYQVLVLTASVLPAALQATQGRWVWGPAPAATSMAAWLMPGLHHRHCPQCLQVGGKPSAPLLQRISTKYQCQPGHYRYQCQPGKVYTGTRTCCTSVMGLLSTLTP